MLIIFKNLQKDFLPLSLQGSVEEWQRVFFLSSGIFIFGWLAYVIFSSSQEQEWGRLDFDTSMEETIDYKPKDNLGFASSVEDVTSVFRNKDSENLSSHM